MSTSDAAVPRDACPESRLPLYSHNDYRSTHPLIDAIEAGFRGVEVDLFLVDGVLRAGHSQREARRGPSFESVYVEPLANVVARCGRLTPVEATPFLLLIEIKEGAPAVFDSVVAALSRHPALVEPRDPGEARGAARAIEIVLVGWTPPASLPGGREHDFLMHQHRMRSPADTVLGSGASSVRLISVDYGKTIGRWWRRDRTRARWFEAIGIVKRKFPDRIVRVHNVPADRAVIERLLHAGADVVGATDVRRFARALGATADARR